MLFGCIKVYAYYTVYIYKNKFKENFKRGDARPVRLSWIRLSFVNIRELESERSP